MGLTEPEKNGGRTRYYHGGVPHLRDEILPPERTGIASTADYGAEGVCRPDRVYLTTVPEVALIFAAGAPSREPGWVYEVEPFGELEPDTFAGAPEESVTARRARIRRVHHRLSITERHAILRLLGVVA